VELVPKKKLAKSPRFLFCHLGSVSGILQARFVGSSVI